ncbi:MAG: hypothetical protein HKN44_14155 [Ilumatobacter sp.]|nr:hypothetical protein [Ilumatobacter sp.]
MNRRAVAGSGALAIVAAGVVLVAARDDPVLSADSLTYLSAADSLRGFDGYRDFTGEPLTHFPPVFPVLLAAGGRSLGWAAVVGASGAAAVSALLVGVLSARVRWSLALVGALLYTLSQAVIRTESTVWSETPYVALALATILVLRNGDVTVRRAAVAGLLAGLALLTRYAGAGLVLTGLVMVVVATRAGGRSSARCAGAYLAVAGSIGGIWMARNLAATGEPLGPHFNGGVHDSLGSIIDQTTRALGRLVVDLDDVTSMTKPAGAVVLIGLLIGSAMLLARRRRSVLDVGIAVFALTSLILPLVSRVLTGTHIEARILSPTMIPLVYLVVVAADGAADRMAGRVRRPAAVPAVGIVAAVGWMTVGLVAAWNGPDRVSGSAANPDLYSPELLALVAAIPDDEHVLTNDPWRVWWHTGREPVGFAYTRPTPGNSHFPLSEEEITARACSADTYLAWFPGLLNAQGAAPAEVRPDLAQTLPLDEIVAVPGGRLFRVAPNCPS